MNIYDKWCYIELNKYIVADYRYTQFCHISCILISYNISFMMCFTASIVLITPSQTMTTVVQNVVICVRNFIKYVNVKLGYEVYLKYIYPFMVLFILSECPHNN
jgi:hypothetical protein